MRHEGSGSAFRAVRDASVTTLPLFPLPAVLFPGGEISLRIFEPRYLDMIRDCARGDRGFGICLMLGSDDGRGPTSSAAIGTLARIVDFNVLEDGLLGILARGEARFRVRSTHVRSNGLLHADVDMLEPDPVLPVPPEFGLLATILSRYHERAGAAFAQHEQSRYDERAWVGFRLAEALPLAVSERQLLLQIADPLDRLSHLMQWLPRFQDA